MKRQQRGALLRCFGGVETCEWDDWLACCVYRLCDNQMVDWNGKYLEGLEFEPLRTFDCYKDVSFKIMGHFAPSGIPLDFL